MNSFRVNPLLVFVGIAVVVFYYCMGIWALPLFDWDEINFAELAREMIESGNYHSPTIGYRPFYEKPPLFIWMQVAAMHVFGAGSFAARLPNVICGLVTLLLLLRLSSDDHAFYFGTWWAALLGVSVLPALYFRSGIIDPWFNLFTFLAAWPLRRPGVPGWRVVAFSGLLLGLAVLTKGPAAGLILGLVCACLLIFRADARGARAVRYLLIGLAGLLPIGLWLVFLWPEDGGAFAGEFLRYQWRLFTEQDAGHGGFPGYHATVLLLGCFPAGVLALPALLRHRVYSSASDRLCRYVFWVTLGVFTVVSTKIVHYSSLCYLPLSYFAARTIIGYERSLGKIGAPAGATVDVPRGERGAMVDETERPKWANWHRWRNATLIILSLYAMVSLLLPLAAWSLPTLRTLFAEDAELLSRLALPVEWPWYSFVPFTVSAAGLAYLIVRRRAHPPHFAAALLIVVFLWTQAALYVFPSRIQAYTQGAAVEFFAGKAGQNVSVGTAYYKSYAHWFYARVPPPDLEQPSTYDCLDRHCRFHGPNPLPLYFAAPLRKRDQVLREVPDAELLYERGGFAFFVRRP